MQNTVQAVALAKPEFNLANGAMIISYDPHPGCSSGTGSGGGSVDLMGAATIKLNGGGIFLNSQESCGFSTPSCADLIITGGAGISSAGTVDNIDQDGCAATVSESLNEDPIAIPDEVYWPPVPPECSTAYKTPKKLGEIMVPGNPQPVEEWLIYPGYYETFPQAVLVANKSHIYMASGVYCIDPGGPGFNWDLSWSSVDAAELNGSTDPTKNKFQDPSSPSYQNFNPDGVTLYIKKGGGFSFNTKSSTYLDATSNINSDYQGYLIVLEGDPATHPTCTINGGANNDINGMIFAPYCNITVNGNSSTTAIINAQLIGWHVTIDGKAGVNFNYDPSNQVKIKRKVGLMK
jgi:hypothetical protein